MQLNVKWILLIQTAVEMEEKKIKETQLPVASFGVEDVQIVVRDVGDVVQMFLPGVDAEDSFSGATWKQWQQQI